MKRTCKFDRTLPAFLDDEMADESRRALREHLPHCVFCRAHLAELGTEQKERSATLGAFPRIVVSPDFDAQVWRKIAAREAEIAQQLPLFERIDALFARPVLKLFASAGGGVAFGLLLVAPFLLANRARPTAPRALSASRPHSADAAISAALLARGDADFWLDDAPTRRSSPRKHLKKEPTWNAVSRARVLQFSRSSASSC